MSRAGFGSVGVTPQEFDRGLVEWSLAVSAAELRWRPPRSEALVVATGSQTSGRVDATEQQDGTLPRVGSALSQAIMSAASLSWPSITSLRGGGCEVVDGDTGVSGRTATHRLVASAIVGVTGCLFLAILTLTIIALPPFADNSHLDRTAQATTSPDWYPSLVGSPKVTVAFMWQHLDLANNDLVGQIAIYIPRSISADLVDANGAKAIDQLASGQVSGSLSIQFFDAKAGRNQSFPVLLSAALPVSTDNTVAPAMVGPVHIVAEGASNSYPDDRYLATIDSVTLALPNNYHLATNVNTDNAQLSRPATVVVSGPDLIDDEVTYETSQDGRLYMQINRSHEVWLFTYLLCAVPVILALLVVHAVALERARKDLPIVLVGLAPALISFIPLRSVLVSSDIRGVTHVDWLLGVEMAGLTLFGAVEYYRYIRARTAIVSEEA